MSYFEIDQCQTTVQRDWSLIFGCKQCCTLYAMLCFRIIIHFLTCAHHLLQCNKQGTV